MVLEVDLEYPKELRELDNDYPLAPDKIGDHHWLVCKKIFKQKCTF